MPKFNVTYEIVTRESAEYGDADERGFVGEDTTLRDALDLLFRTRTNEVAGIETIEPSGSFARWVTVINGMEYRTGATESRSLHIPSSVSDSSRARIVRLVQGK